MLNIRSGRLHLVLVHLRIENKERRKSGERAREREREVAEVSSVIVYRKESSLNYTITFFLFLNHLCSIYSGTSSEVSNSS